MVDSSRVRWSLAIAVGWLALPIAARSVTAGAPPVALAPTAAQLEAFEREVRPLLHERCGSCHGAEKSKGGLRLDSRAAILQGGESGPAVVPGKPDASLLLDVLGDDGPVQMPPKTRLKPGEVAILARWVAAGLPWPAASPPPRQAVGAGGIDLPARKASHWAWRPIVATPPPPVKNPAWPREGIDRFILARLEAAGLEPAREAERRVLIRRLSFDLTGLPPTPRDVHAFLEDQRPDAYERLVDRLLASPAFGERWGRHWLDLVRYAESRGHEFDPNIPNAWRYRDYVVRALNADLPYNRFLAEHLAGDLLPAPRIDAVTHTNESILATGFWFLGEEVHSPVDLKQDEADRLDNRLDVMTKTFLGLTVACARCHDHKFDAITQRDYYGLIGFLQSSTYRQARVSDPTSQRQTAERLDALRQSARPRLLALAAAALRAELDTVDRQCRERTEAGSSVVAADPWLAEIPRARRESSHPWNRLRERAPEREPSKPAARPSSSSSPSDPRARLVVDFGSIGRLDRVQNGLAFGSRPRLPGELEFRRDGVGLNDVAAASLDQAWPIATTVPGEGDHGRLGGWPRAGQTLRTPEFTLRSGRVWIRARGAGRSYASIQSHLVVAGPLHGAVMTEWTDGGKGWRWVHHDLTAYQGHRLHIEFSPRDTEDLAVAQVVDAEAMPAEPPTASPISGPPSGSETEQTRAVAADLRALARRMEADAIVGAGDATTLAPAADLVLRMLARDTRPPGLARQAYQAEVGRVLGAVAALRQTIFVNTPTAPALLDGNGVDSAVLVRGSPRVPGPVAPRRFLEALDGPSPLSAADGGSGRLELVDRMLDGANPFVPRVLVNRVWHHLFGRGLVASVDNFGVLGEAPTHPELLDFLARRFVDEGWSIKTLVRSIVLSRTYRMDSQPDSASDSADPENKGLHRRSVKRLEAEPIRDAILAVSGRLDPRLGGPSVPVYLTPFMQGRGRPAVSGPLDGDGRRSIYLAVRRNFLAPMMLAFDAPIPFTAMGRRNVSNVPAQALILMNDPFVAAEARRWADRIVGSAATGPERVGQFFEEAFARRPSDAEQREALSFIRQAAADLGVSENDPRPWADLAHVLLNSKEFVFIE